MIPETKSCPTLLLNTEPFSTHQRQFKRRLSAYPLTKPLKAFWRTGIIFIIYFSIMGFQTFYNWFYVSDFAGSDIYLASAIYSVLCITIGIIALLFRKKIITMNQKKKWWQNYNQICIFIQFTGLIYHAQLNCFLLDEETFYSESPERMICVIYCIS